MTAIIADDVKTYYTGQLTDRQLQIDNYKLSNNLPKKKKEVYNTAYFATLTRCQYILILK
jgi:hypothetical protein